MQNKLPIASAQSGFTLIELSLVLVIIGLIIGGILTGRDLIAAAAARAQIAQIEKYNTAVHAFQGKYGGLPGDLADPVASQFGFQSRGSHFGEGDGNGIIEGNCNDVATPNAASPPGMQTGCGELAVFWEDLSKAGLIDAAISGHDVYGANYPFTTGAPTSITFTSTPAIKDWLPAARIGGNNSIYLYSLNGKNYFGLSYVSHIGDSVQSSTEVPGLTVQQAYMIDAKADDGLPQSGAINACYVNFDLTNYRGIWAAMGTLGAGSLNCVPTTTGTTAASTDCYTNNGNAGTMIYSIAQNATALNCALSFQFQ